MNASARVIPAVWTWGIALVFLLTTGAWMLPAQLIQSIPAIRIGPHFGEFVAGSLCAFVTVAGILATAFGIGAVILAPRDRLEGLYALALGFGVVAVATLGLGAMAVSNVPWAFAGLLAWLLPGPRRYLEAIPGIRGAVRHRALPTTLVGRAAPSPPHRLDGWAKAMLACVVVAAALNLPGTLAPPFEYDELEYHLGALADYRRIGHIAFLPHNFYSNMPQLTEMLYLLAGSGESAKLLHWTFGVLTAVTVFLLAGKLWSRRAGATAAALFYCLPFVQDLSQTARIDLATTFFGTLAFGAVLLEWPGWAAMAAGCAVATKWPAVAVVLLPVLAMMGSVRRSAACGLLAVAFVLPWLLKNWLLTGNPVYPLLSNMMPSPHWSAEQAAVFAGKHYPSFDLLSFVRLAWDYSMNEPRAVPVLLMAAPLVLLRRASRSENTPYRVAWLFVGAYVGWWALTFRPWRFLFPAFPLAALIGAYACRDWIVKTAVAVILAVAMSALALNAVVDVESPERVPAKLSFAQYALGQASRDEFIARVGYGVLEPVVWMNANLPATARVLYVGEARAYYARHDVVWCTAFDQFPATSGVTHVYVNHSELKRLHNHYGYPRGLDIEPLLRGAREIYRARNAVIYEL